MKVTTIGPKNKFLDVNLREIWEYRHLLYSLAWRDIKVRYIQSVLGITWLFLKPLFSLLILVFIFNTVIKVETENVPPIVFTMSGIIVWSYFSSLIEDAGNSILNAQEMVKKIYFPRLVLPLSKALSGLLEFTASLLLMFFFLLYFGIFPSVNFIFFPLFVLLTMLAASGLGILISGLTIRYRDLKFVVPFFLRIGLYVSPVAYSTSLIPEKYEFVLYLNPLIGIIDGFRWSIFGSDDGFGHIWFACIIIPILFVISVFIFSKVEHTIADII